MATAKIDALRRAIRRRHGCGSVFVEWASAVGRLKRELEVFGRVTSAELEVRARVGVFDLVGHPSARRAYAWSGRAPGSKRSRYEVVLRLGKIDSPDTALGAVLARSQYRA